MAAIDEAVEAVAGGERAARAVLAEIARALRKTFHGKQPWPELLTRARRALARFEPILARTVSDALLSAWLLGAEKAASKLKPLEPGASRLPPLPPQPVFTLAPAKGPEPIIRYPVAEAAAKSLAEKRVVTQAEFDALSEDAQRAAFTVARVGTLDALQKLQAAIVQDLAEGGTLRGFARKVGEVLEGSELSPARIETVYRTNVGRAYTSGLIGVLNNPYVADEFPYLAYHAIHDQRVRPEHLALEKLGLNGTNVYRRDDPLWRTFLPPWDWNCRCGIVPLTIEQAAKLGVHEAQEWLRTGEPPAAPEWVKPPPFEPSPSFVSVSPGEIAVAV